MQCSSVCPHFDDCHFDMPTNPVLLHLLLPTNQAVARGVGEFLPELQVGGSYGSLDLRGPNTREGVDSNFLSARCDEVDPTSSQIPVKQSPGICDEVDPTSSQIPVKTDQGICDEVGPTSSQIPLGPGFIPFGNYHLIFSCQDPSTECHGKVR